jgi:hypothetical protein
MLIVANKPIVLSVVMLNVVLLSVVGPSGTAVLALATLVDVGS